VSANDLELVRTLYDRWSKGDFATTDMFDPAIEFARIGSTVVGGEGGPGRWHGIEQLWPAISAWLRNWTELHVSADEIVDLGDRVLVLSRQRARGRASSAPVEHELAELFTVRDGRVVVWESYWDRAEGLSAAGLT
jgi:ketosteroid isomerase-like protein